MFHVEQSKKVSLRHLSTPRGYVEQLKVPYQPSLPSRVVPRGTTWHRGLFRGERCVVGKSVPRGTKKQPRGPLAAVFVVFVRFIEAF